MKMFLLIEKDAPPDHPLFDLAEKEIILAPDLVVGIAASELGYVEK